MIFKTTFYLLSLFRLTQTVLAYTDVHFQPNYFALSGCCLLGTEGMNHLMTLEFQRYVAEQSDLD
jgi:hypothetical protein